MKDLSVAALLRITRMQPGSVDAGKAAEELARRIPHDDGRSGEVEQLCDVIEAIAEGEGAVLNKTNAATLRQVASNLRSAWNSTDNLNATKLMDALEAEMDYIMEQPLNGDRMHLTKAWRQKIEEWIMEFRPRLVFAGADRE